MKPVVTSHLFALLLLGLSSRAEGTKCTELYAAAYPNSNILLACQSFPGDNTLHAIIHGCNSVNQDQGALAGYTSQSFTQICEAQVTEEVKYTCYDMAEDTDYTAFTSSVDTSLTCFPDDAFDTPKYFYQQSKGEYTSGGGVGSQSTDVPNVESDFKPELASEVYFMKTVESGDPPLTQVPAATEGDGAAEDGGDTDMDDKEEHGDGTDTTQDAQDDMDVGNATEAPKSGAITRSLNILLTMVGVIAVVY